MIKCLFCNYEQVVSDAVFCTNCGTRLIAEAKPAVASDRLKFWGGELRLLSAFFVNFTGFEKFTEPHDFRYAMIYIRECLKELEGMVKNTDGTANQIIPDDRLLGIFGAPRAHQDDPLRAVRCAYQIKNWWLERRSQLPFLANIDMTIGVNTGRAFFGYVLEASSLLTVIGDTINIACRLAEIAPAQEILISQTTYDRVLEYVDVEHIGERTVKGKTAKIDVYLLKTIREKPKVPTAQKIPLFGRHEAFQKLLSLAQGIKNKRMAICIIRGQMGIGKSRLKEEFEEQLSRDASFSFLETHCSTEIESPYFPFKFLLRSYLKLNETDSKEVTATKIVDIVTQKGLSAVDVKGIKHLFLTDLRRLRGDEIRSINEEIYASIKNIIRDECRKQPLILIFEEFNRADAMSRELISYLAMELANEPLMFLMVNVSNEFIAAISNTVKNIEEINLAALSLAEVSDLIKFILKDVDDRVVDFFFRTSGGNPLFAIEAIKHTKRAKVLKEVSGHWVLEKEQRLPFFDDLYGVVMSTIDSLASDYRMIIDYASVIGYSFDLRILKELFNKPNLKDQVSHLVNEGYIMVSKEEPEAVYIFRHNLLKDAAYTVLPVRKKKEIHQQVAKLFETLYAGQITDFYENIGHHYLACDNFKKSATYFKLAGDRAKNLYAIDQAFAFYKTVLKIKKDHDLEVANDLVRGILLNLTDLYEIGGNIQKMDQITQAGLASAVDDKDFESEMIFTERNGYAQLLLGQLDKSERTFLAAVHQISNKMIELSTILYSDLGILYAQKYEYEKSILNYNLSWYGARANNLKDGEILCLLNLAHLHRNLGNYEQSLEYLHYCLDNLVAPEDLRRAAQFKYLIADINFQIWNLEKAKSLLMESSIIAESIGSIDTYIRATLDLAVLSSMNGTSEESEKYLQAVDKKISFFTRENLLAEINLKKAQVYYNKKDYNRARNFNTNALKIAQKFSQKEIEIQGYGLVAQIEEHALLEQALKALEIAETIKLPPSIAQALYWLTRIYAQSNDGEKVRHYGRKALLIYDDIKNKLKPENRQYFVHKPEYAKLLET